MRTLAYAALFAVSALAVPQDAQAYRDGYPICMRVFGDPTYISCTFNTIEQCKATASGRAAECFADPFLVSTKPVRQRRTQRAPY